jgi:ATP-dependent RNA helicase SUPV3L1/SUV3
VVTQSMTSLTGSAGEDFASILRALGYRMEKRLPLPPAPAPVAVEASVAETTPAEAASAEIASEETPSETTVEASAAIADADVTEPTAAVETGDIADVANDVPPANDNVSSATLPPDIAFSPEPSEPVAAQPEPAASGDVEAAATETPQQTEAPQDQTVVEATIASADATPADASAAIAAAPDAVAVPEMVEVWRPGGRSEERRPRHDRSRYRNQDPAQEGAKPVAAEGETAEGAKRERHGRGRRERNKDFRKPRTDAPTEAASAVVAADGAPAVPREAREDKGRPPRERFQGKGRDSRDKGKFAGKPKGDREGGRSSGGPSHRQYASSAPPRERERPIDPNSPFAKLAALKEQLTAGRKE